MNPTAWAMESSSSSLFCLGCGCAGVGLAAGRGWGVGGLGMLGVFLAGCGYPVETGVQAGFDAIG